MVNEVCFLLKSYSSTVVKPLQVIHLQLQKNGITHYKNHFRSDAILHH
jgi:hypothetical protein